MRIQTEEWQRFIPGVRMYKGKKTLFYNGEILWDDDENEGWLIYDWEEQQSWEVLIVLPGVEVISRKFFSTCEKLETVIMADDSVETIEESAFAHCRSLKFVRLSRNLEFIGKGAFLHCTSLTSIFIPPSCREIDNEAFQYCSKLIIFNVSRQTQLGEHVIANTALIRGSPFKVSSFFGNYENTEEVNQWIKGINEDDTYELHQACSSFNPLIEIIYGIVKRKGPCAFHKKNEIGMTAVDYLEANPCIENEIDQNVLMKRYVLEMMGEAV
ncbi:hypothetical protein CTEN210_06767 [Chaetoceros tenuissimus]|uniref:Leucine-rich repeat domain-containing protein n=1 Tax=Chaetoceros tenuissimus TaxID=426638 RepID=A0AAD3CQH2_9STRA|nr:hypothetical protein CTEN210_06767 [Chaetoceros tenuissimus]